MSEELNLIQLFLDFFHSSLPKSVRVEEVMNQSGLGMCQRIGVHKVRNPIHLKMWIIANILRIFQFSKAYLFYLKFYNRYIFLNTN